MKKYDLHTHTYHSRCSNLRPETLLKKAKEKGLDGIAVTDHNTIKGALETKRWNKDKNFEVIVGEEIMTDKGEILALYLKKDIRPGKFHKVIKDIKRQKGISVIAHPFATGIRKNADQGLFKHIDAIEGFNARSLFKFENIKAQIKAKELDLPVTAGSDSHFSSEVGRAYTEFDGTLRNAIKNKKTNIKGNNLFSFIYRLRSSLKKYLDI
ncbi:PHP domain-containing protein [Candidatus Woesearchaeota archaeon]|nr:PHP domain-containing protein [Candidatus Woesearchaeota archaeon]